MGRDHELEGSSQYLYQAQFAALAQEKEAICHESGLFALKIREEHQSHSGGLEASLRETKGLPHFVDPLSAVE